VKKHKLLSIDITLGSVGIQPRKDIWALSDLYHTPDFENFYNQLHPELLEFITEAMRVYAAKNLS